jgi:hypothetical protein
MIMESIFGCGTAVFPLKTKTGLFSEKKLDTEWNGPIIRDNINIAA